MVVYVYIPRPQKKTGRDLKFKASLCYMVEPQLLVNKSKIGGRKKEKGYFH